MRGQLDGPALLPAATATGTIADIVTPPAASGTEDGEEVVGDAVVVGVAMLVSDSERDRPQAVIVRTTKADARYFVIE